MTNPVQNHRAPRIDPGLIDAATRHAHALRRQAIDDTLLQIGEWLRRPFDTPAKTTMQAQPCHS